MAKIDRDAAVGVMFRLYEEAAIRWRAAGKNADAGAMIALDRAALELSRLPYEVDLPGLRWTPLTEAVPETDKDVLVSLDNGEVLTGWRYDEEDGCWFLGTGDAHAGDDEIRAWAPMPEPYEEEQDDAGAD